MALPVSRTPNAAPVAEGWDPARELGELHSRMEQLMESVWSGALADGGAWSPLVDVEEADDAWIVEADLPGVKPEDVEIELRDSQLSITGEIKERERVGILRRRTRRVGRFEYHVTLPGDANPDDIDASLNDGVLRVRIPKSQRSRPRRIEVSNGSKG